MSILLALVATLTGAMSATLGMAGGMVLLGAFTALLPVGEAMVLHAGTQLLSNLGRAVLLRRWIGWRTVVAYVAATVLTTVALRGVVHLPSPVVIWVLLGVTPIVARRLPVPTWLDADTPFGAALAGVACTTLQVFGGAAGPIFDVFWARSVADRRRIVATKAATTTVAHLARLAWFLPLVQQPPAVSTLAMTGLGTLVGTTLGTRWLEQMDAGRFRSLTGRTLDVIGAGYLVAAAWALA